MKMNRLAVILAIINLAVLIFVLAQNRTTAAPAASDVLRARVFELVDEHGQVRAQLNVEDSGEVVFRLRDADGTIRVKLGAAQDGSGLFLLNDMTEPGIQLLAGQDGASLMLAEQGKAPRVIEP